MPLSMDFKIGDKEVSIKEGDDGRYTFEVIDNLIKYKGSSFLKLFKGFDIRLYLTCCISTETIKVIIFENICVVEIQQICSEKRELVNCQKEGADFDYLCEEIRKLRKELKEADVAGSPKEPEYNTIDVYFENGKLCIGIETDEDRKFEERFFSESVDYGTMTATGEYFRIMDIYRIYALADGEKFKYLTETVRASTVIGLLKNVKIDNCQIEFNKLFAKSVKEIDPLVKKMEERSGRYHIARINYMPKRRLVLDSYSDAEKILEIYENELLKKGDVSISDKNNRHDITTSHGVFMFYK